MTGEQPGLNVNGAGGLEAESSVDVCDRCYCAATGAENKIRELKRSETTLLKC